MSAYEIRPLRDHAEMEQCVALQRTTWGATFGETVPPALLWVAQRTGGIASGAFDASGQLVGFVFGVSGVSADRRLIHWSDMLAVRPDLRGQGLGIALKRHQRELLLERGIETVYWTFDPLEARNAHINFHRLGVIAREYLRDLYGDTGSHLHAGIGTDRLVAEWHLAASRVVARLETASGTGEGGDVDERTARPAGSSAGDGISAEVRIAVPLDIQRLKAEDPAAAREQRKVTRAAFEDYLGRGWVVVDAVRGPDALHYVLRPDSGH